MRRHRSSKPPYSRATRAGSSDCRGTLPSRNVRAALPAVPGSTIAAVDAGRISHLRCTSRVQRFRVQRFRNERGRPLETRRRCSGRAERTCSGRRSGRIADRSRTPRPSTVDAAKLISTSGCRIRRWVISMSYDAVTRANTSPSSLMDRTSARPGQVISGLLQRFARCRKRLADQTRCPVSEQVGKDDHQSSDAEVFRDDLGRVYVLIPCEEEAD